MKQRTICESVSCTGVGLHSGTPVQLTLRPAPVDTGIVFARVDRARPVEIPANPRALRATTRATTLGRGDATIGTVEHLFAALYGLGVDNLRAEVDGAELPIMDGSAAPFVYLLRSAGIRNQPRARRVLRMHRPVEVRDGGRHIRIEPARGLGVSYAVDFDHPAIGRQELHLDSIDPDRFERDICAARTFGFVSEVRALRDAGFARGGSLDNSVLLDDTGIVNSDGLRWADEFVRHKVLDLLGDLAVLGVALHGHIHVERGGHSLHQKLVAAIAAQPEAWRIDEPAARPVSDRAVAAPALPA